MRAEIIHRCGGWSSEKGQLNYQNIKKIGDILDVESSDRAFAAILLLITERQGWGDPSEFWRAADLESWLVLVSRKWFAIMRLLLRIENLQESSSSNRILVCQSIV